MHYIEPLWRLKHVWSHVPVIACLLYRKLLLFHHFYISHEILFDIFYGRYQHQIVCKVFFLFLHVFEEFSFVSNFLFWIKRTPGVVVVLTFYFYFKNFVQLFCNSLILTKVRCLFCKCFFVRFFSNEIVVR